MNYFLVHRMCHGLSTRNLFEISQITQMLNKIWLRSLTQEMASFTLPKLQLLNIAFNEYFACKVNCLVEVRVHGNFFFPVGQRNVLKSGYT